MTSTSSLSGVEASDFDTDAHRPRFHFLPPSGWMNDPNGLVFVDGRLHLFYQHNPDGPFHDRIQWGHAVSDDLVTWTHKSIALVPTPGGYDRDGCWSGCAVVHDGVPTIVYTGLAPHQVQCLATSHDGLETWTKASAPILDEPPAGVDLVGDPPEIRDPWVWRDGDGWSMLLGSGVHPDATASDRGPEGVLLLYRSTDLRTWTYEGIAHRGRFAPDTAVWECPNLFRLGDRDVVLVSEQLEYKHTYMQSGRFDGRSFTPSWTGVADHGAYFYAGLSVLDPADRRLLFGWIKEGRAYAKDDAHPAALWSGVLSLARVLSLDGDGSLRMTPAPEYASLRGPEIVEAPRRLGAGTRWDLPRLRGDTLELFVRARVPAGARLNLLVRATPGGEERTLVGYDGSTRELTVDTTEASLALHDGPEIVNVKHRGEERIELRVFVDRSVLEVFLDDRTCVTSRMYPTRSDAVGVALEAEGAAVDVDVVRGWHLDGVW